jgi:cytidine deaminase
MEYKTLIKEALHARAFSYAPVTGFKVGAALLTKSGKVFTGCNIENAALTPANCAERTAFFKAVSEGERDFAAIAVAGGYGDTPVDYCPPCGVCRQVMAEFCGPDFFVITAKSEEDYKTYTFGELLPEAFGPGMLKKSGGRCK